ncbi:MAG: hypothetical protein QM793_13210 [Muricomes sp.]
MRTRRIKVAGTVSGMQRMELICRRKVSTAKTGSVKAARTSEIVSLSEVSADDHTRILTGIHELDRVRRRNRAGFPGFGGR